MNDRERSVNCVKFRAVDQIPRWEWSYRQDTWERWYKEGLPAEVAAGMDLVKVRRDFGKSLAIMRD